MTQFSRIWGTYQATCSDVGELYYTKFSKFGENPKLETTFKQFSPILEKYTTEMSSSTKELA